MNNCLLTFEIPVDWTRYLFEKGFVALNGCSLTLTRVDKEVGQFDVWLIPETLRSTTFAPLEVGDFVNVEIDRKKHR